MARGKKGEGDSRRKAAAPAPKKTKTGTVTDSAVASRKVASAAPAKSEPVPRKTEPSGPSLFGSLLSATWVLPAVLVLAAVFRIAHVMALAQTPFFDHLGLDPLAYDEWGQRIAAGDWMGSRIFYQDPLYPYFLGVLYSIFGRQLMLVYLLQIGFGLATCWLTAVLGRRMFGVAAGNLAALMAALFTPSIFYEVQIEKTFLSVFLVTAFLVLFLDRRIGARVAAGAVLALASLTRANLILFIPLGAALLLFERDRPAKRPRPNGDPNPSKLFYDFLRMPDSSGMMQAAAFFGGAALMLAPVALRNHHVEGQWVLTTSQAGQNFYIGNNPMNTTGSYIVPSSIRPDPRYEEMDFRAAAEKGAGRKLTPSEVSAYWWGESWKHISHDPVFAQMMMLRKFMLFWNDYEVPDNLNMYLLERWSWVLRLPLLGIGAITALAVLGAGAWFRRKTEVRVLVGFTAVYCATVVAFFIFSRYRIQIVPVLLVLAAAGVLWLEEQFRRARWESVAGGTAAILMTGFFCFQQFDWTDKDKAVAISLNNLGALYQEMGDSQKAVETYEEAVKLSPQGVIGAMRILGDHYMRAGSYDRAEYFMRQVVTYKPESQMGWNALVQLYSTRRSRGDADPTLSDKLALALISAGRAGEARKVVDEARAAGTLPSDEVERRLQAGR